MLGTIIGNIVGSPYETDNIKTTKFKLFGKKSRFTGDTVMTLAVAEALRNGGKRENYIAAMRRFSRKHPDAGYGERFVSWLNSKKAKPYNSCGNGSAMRVSPVAWWFDSLEEVEKEAKFSAAITHNHPEGIKGAQATAAAIFLARKGESKDTIRGYIGNKYGYDLRRTLREIRPAYGFDPTCQGSVPEAIIAWLESTGFEDAIRNAVSLGGDSDTLAAITGSIAEAEYGVPEDIKEQALSRLDQTLRFACLCWKIDIKDRFGKDLSDLEDILAESLFDETFPGLTNYVRDVNLPDGVADKYTAGRIIAEPGLCDASSRVMGMATTHRFAILSNHMADFRLLEQGTNWGLHVAQAGSYFKVLGSHTHKDKTLIILLHLPKGTWKVFQRMTSNIEEQVRDTTIKNFVNKLDTEPIPELSTDAWLERCVHPIGMDEHGEFNELDLPGRMNLESMKDLLTIGEFSLDTIEDSSVRVMLMAELLQNIPGMV
ncbi:MAG: ADP-ribosylglycohydrolase family protein [Synergistaceae bacterium]|nr:ADP-ribosylglycohydrolase family protein [Synergistaceae bacterium]